MMLGQVNILRKLLSKFKEIISQKYRREVLSEIIWNSGVLNMYSKIEWLESYNTD